jgi:hypothetical protein
MTGNFQKFITAHPENDDSKHLMNTTSKNVRCMLLVDILAPVSLLSNMNPLLLF